MSRKLFKDVKLGEPEPDESKEYTPPEESVVDAELVKRLLQNYIKCRDSDGTIIIADEFKTQVMTIESLIGDAKGFNPQSLIDLLAFNLRDESDNKVLYTRTDYLTAVVQALYNLGHTTEFVMDIRGWGKKGYFYAGYFLTARENNPITLEFHGDFRICCRKAEHCEFIFHGRAGQCGPLAENCTFSLMPGAEIKSYQGKSSKGNVWRKMNEEGEWEVLSQRPFR